MRKFNKKIVKQESEEEDIESGSEEDVGAESAEEQDDDDQDFLDNEAEEDDEVEEADEGEEEEDGEDEEGEEEEGEEEEDEEDEDDNPLTPKKIPFNTPKVEAKNDLVTKFLELNGRRLYIRFPSKLPESEEELTKQLKGYCDLIQKVIKPRQKYARHCMVEFANKNDREKIMKILSDVEIDGKKLVVKLSKVDEEGFVEKALERKEKKRKEKKKKQKLRKLAKKQAASITSTLFISNIPPTATVADLKEHFPNAIDIKVKHSKDSQGTAKGSVTLPTPEDATKGRKLKITIHEHLLNIKFDVSGKKISWRMKQNKKYKAEQKKQAKLGTALKRKALDEGDETPKSPAKKFKTEKPAKSPAKKVKVEKPAGTEVGKKKGKKKPKTSKKGIRVGA